MVASDSCQTKSTFLLVLWGHIWFTKKKSIPSLLKRGSRLFVGQGLSWFVEKQSTRSVCPLWRTVVCGQGPSSLVYGTFILVSAMLKSSSRPLGTCLVVSR